MSEPAAAAPEAGPSFADAVFARWRQDLTHYLALYRRHRGSGGPGLAERETRGMFLAKLFLFFVVVNIGCYWLAMVIAFPGHAFGDEAFRYLLVQFPVGVLGSLFDTVSFFITVRLVEHAIQAERTRTYMAYLSIDGVIAVIASCWVIFVFFFSAWLIDLATADSTSLQGRAEAYTHLATQSFFHPLAHIRDIFFGSIMGLSSMLPTVFHLGLFARSIRREWRWRRNGASSAA